MNGSGPLSFEAYVGDKDFNKTFEAMERRVFGFTENANKSLSSIESTFTNLGRVAAGAFAINSLSDIPAQIVRVRGEFQQLEIALNTMLGSKAKADQLMGEVVQLAASTPFGLKEAAQATKQLLAYGSASTEVVSELRMLGDVAAGVGAPLGDLAYLYGTLRTQGKAFTVDIRQFAGRGIPIYEELAKVLKVNTDEVATFVEQGRVGFKEVQQAFKNMSGEGGAFENLMAKQSASLTGLTSQFSDAVDIMLNDLGRSTEGVAATAITTATGIVENYEPVLKVLTVMVATYGTYKTALAAVAVAQRLIGASATATLYLEMARGLGGVTTATYAQAVALGVQTQAQAALNAVMAINPYVAAATAIVALAGAVWILSDTTTAAEVAQKSYNAVLEEQKKKKEDLISKTGELTGIINSGNSTTFAQIQAYSALQKLYPAMLNSLTLQEFKLLKAADAQKQLNAAMDQMGIAGVESDFEKAQKKVDELTKKIQDLKLLQSQSGPGAGGLVLPISNAEKALEAAKIEAEKFGAQVKQNTADAWEANTPVEDQVKHYEDLKKSLESQRSGIENNITSLKKAGAEANNLQVFFANMSLLGLNQQLDQVGGKLLALQGKPNAMFGGNKGHWEKISSEATDKRNALGINQEGSAEWKRLTKEIDEADKHLKIYNKTKEVAQKKVPERDKPQPFGSLAYFEQVARKADEIISKTPGTNTAEIARQNQIKIAAEAKADEIRKSLAVKTFDNELSEKKNKYELYQRWVDHYSKSAADAQFADLLKSGESYADYLNGEIRKLETQKNVPGIGLVAPEMETLVKLRVELAETNGSKTPVQLLEEELSNAKEEAKSLTEYLDILYSKQSSVGSGGGSTGADKRKVLSEQIINTEKELKSNLDEFLKESAVYTKKRFDVETRYNNLRKTAFKKLNREELSDALKAIDTQRKAELEALADGEQEQSEAFKRLHAEYLDYGRKQIKQRLADLQTLLKAETISAERRKELEFELAKVKRELNTNTVEGIRQAAGLLNNVLGEVDLKISKTFSIAMRDLSGALTNVSTLMDSEASTMDQIGSIIGLVSFVAVTVRDAFMKAEDLFTGMESQESYYTNIKNEIEGANILLERQATLLDRLAGVNKIQGSENLIGEYAKQQEEALKSLQDMTLDVISKETEVFVDPILGTKVKNKGFGGVWTQLMTGGKAKTKIEYEFENIDTSGFTSIEDFIKLLSDIKKGGGKINGQDVVSADLESLELLIKTYQEAEAAQAQLLEDFKTFLTATTQAGIVDSIVDGFRNGKLAAADFADDFQVMMQNALLNSLKAKLMNQDMDQFYKKFSDFSLSDGVLTGAEIKELQSDYAELIAKGKQQYDDIQKISGIDLSNSTDGSKSTDPLRGAIQGMSQETASILAGQFNGLRISGADTANSLRQMLLFQANISANSNYLRRLEGLENLMIEANRISKQGWRLS